MTASKGVPREFYDDALRVRDDAMARCASLEGLVAELSRELAALKRHDVDAVPRASFAADLLNPEHGLGPLTVAAVEEFAAGDVELTGKLLSRAHSLTAQAKASRPDAPLEAVDRYVAKIIEEGDTG